MTSSQPMIYQLVSSYSHPSEQIIESLIQTIVSKVSNVDSSTSTTSLDVVTTLYPTTVGNNTTHLEHSWTPVRHSFIPHLQQTLPTAAALLVSAPAPSATPHNDQVHQRKRSRPRTLRVLPRLLRVGGVSVDRAEWVTNATRDCLNAGHYPYIPINSTLGESPTVLPALATVGPISRAIIDTHVQQKGYPSLPESAHPRADPLSPAMASTLALFVPEPSSQSPNYCTDAKNRSSNTHTPKDLTPCPSCCRVTMIPLPLSLAPVAAVEEAISGPIRDSSDRTRHAHSHSHAHAHALADPCATQESLSTHAHNAPGALPRLCVCCARHERSPLAHAVMQSPSTRPISHAPQAYAHADAACTATNAVDKVRVRAGARASLPPGTWLRAPGPVAGVCVRVWAHVSGVRQCVEEWRVAVRAAEAEAGVSPSAGEAGAGSATDAAVRSLRALLSAAAQSVGAVAGAGRRPQPEEEAEDERGGSPSLAALLRASSDELHTEAMQDAAGADVCAPVAAALSDDDGAADRAVAADTRAMLATMLRALPPHTHAPPIHPPLAPSSHARAPTPPHTHAPPAPPALGLASLLRAVSTLAGGVLPALVAEASASHSRAWASVSVEPLLACVDAKTDALAGDHLPRSRGASASLPLAATWHTLLPVREAVHVAVHSHTSAHPRTLQLGARRTTLALCVELRRHPRTHRALRLARAHVPLAVPDVCPRWQRWELWCAALRAAWGDLERHAAAMINTGAAASGAPPTPQPGSAAGVPVPGAPAASAAAMRALALAAVFGGLPAWLTQPHCDGDADAEAERDRAGDNPTGDGVVALDAHVTHHHHSVGGAAWADAIAAVRVRLHEGQELLQESVPQALALAGAVAARGWRRVGAREAWQAMGAAGLRAVVAAGDDVQRREVAVLAQANGARGSGDVHLEESALVAAARDALQPRAPLLPHTHHAHNSRAHTPTNAPSTNAPLSTDTPLTHTDTDAAPDTSAAATARALDASGHNSDDSRRASAVFAASPATAADTVNTAEVAAQVVARTGACLSSLASAGEDVSTVASARDGPDTPSAGSAAGDVAVYSNVGAGGGAGTHGAAEDAQSAVTLSPAHTPTRASASTPHTPLVRAGTAAASAPLATEASPLTSASPSSPPLPPLAAHTPTRVHAHTPAHTHASLARHLSSYVSSGSLSSLASIGSIGSLSLTSLSLSISLSMSSPSSSPLHSHSPSAASSPAARRPPVLAHTRTDARADADTDVDVEAAVGAEAGGRVMLLTGRPARDAATPVVSPAPSPAYSMPYSLPESLPGSYQPPPRMSRRRSSGPRGGGDAGGDAGDDDGDHDDDHGGAEDEGGRDRCGGEIASRQRQHALPPHAVEGVLVASDAGVAADAPAEPPAAATAPAPSTDSCSMAGSGTGDGGVVVAGEPVRTAPATATHTTPHATAPDALYAMVDASSDAALVGVATGPAAGHGLAPALASLPLLATGSGSADARAGADDDVNACVAVLPSPLRAHAHAPLLATPLTTPAHARAATYAHAHPSTLARAASRVADTSHPRLSGSLSSTLLSSSSSSSSPSPSHSPYSPTSTSTIAYSGPWCGAACGQACVATAGEVSRAPSAHTHSIAGAVHEESVEDGKDEEEGLAGGDVLLVEEVGCMTGEASATAPAVHVHHRYACTHHNTASGHTDAIAAALSSSIDGSASNYVGHVGDAAVDGLSLAADGVSGASGWAALQLLEARVRRDADLIVVAGAHSPPQTCPHSHTHSAPTARLSASLPLWPRVSLHAAAVEAVALLLGGDAEDEAEDEAGCGHLCEGVCACVASAGTGSGDSVTNDRAGASTCVDARVCACGDANAAYVCSACVLRPPVRAWRLARVGSQTDADTGIGTGADTGISARMAASACEPLAVDDSGLAQHPPARTAAPLNLADSEEDGKIVDRDDSKTNDKNDVRADGVAVVCAIGHSLPTACAYSEAGAAVGTPTGTTAVAHDELTATAYVDDQCDDTVGYRSNNKVADTCNSKADEARDLCARLEREAAEAVVWLPLHGVGVQGSPWDMSTLFL